ncbi:MAG: ferritin-like domain-containing protein [Sandaracinus sp.]
MTQLRATPSGTPIEEERQAIERGLRRIPPSSAVFDRGAWDPAAIALVIQQWTLRMEIEHRSSMVFSQLAQQLFEANAPLDTKIVMMRMAQDELRHTATCAEVLVALGVEPVVDVSLEVAPLAKHEGVSLEERALRNVLYTTCLSEMVACARFVATLDRTTDPFMRDQTRRLLADEVLHGQFGFHYLAAVQPWLDAHPEARAGVERFLVHAFAVIEGELAPTPPFPVLPPDALALGADDPALAREVFYGTMEGAIVPGLERLGIAAGASWKGRRRLV